MGNQQTQNQLPSTKFTFDKTYVFRLRRHNKDNFSGLWELCILGPKGQVVEQLTDADALNYCLENMQGRLETDGF
jgi:hypothetical protein